MTWKRTMAWKMKVQVHLFTRDQITQDALQYNASWSHMHILCARSSHMHLYTYTYTCSSLPLPALTLFKGFGPHVTWHLSADNGIYSQLLSHSALKPTHTHTHIHTTMHIFHPHVWLLLNAHTYHPPCVIAPYLSCVHSKSVWTVNSHSSCSE